MKEHKTVHQTFNHLRKQAEELMKAKDFCPEHIQIEDPLRLIHELQAFQIELELQNEELHRSQQELMKTQIRYAELYDCAPLGYISVSLKGLILSANLTFSDMISTERSYLINQPLSVYITFEDQDIYYGHRQELLTSKTKQVCELRLQNKERIPFYVQLESTIVFNKKEIQELRTMVIDISDRKRAEEALVLKNNKLEEALLKVNELSGLLPICSRCKKIRDDKGYWNQIESYIESHSETKFTHGICPDCSDELYGSEAWYSQMKKSKKE